MIAFTHLIVRFYPCGGHVHPLGMEGGRLALGVSLGPVMCSPRLQDGLRNEL